MGVCVRLSFTEGKEGHEERGERGICGVHPGGKWLSGRVAKGETDAHRELKRLALHWAQTNGLAICACEVRVPKSGYRADVAACSRRRGKREGARPTQDAWGQAPLSGDGIRTAVFECKQARADLLKDARREEEARRKVEELSARARKLEELIGGHRPDLRRGEALFPEFDAWDFTGIEHETHRRVLAELATWQERLLHGTKFAKLWRWRGADFFYLVSEDGIFAEAEVPAGWGLLVRRGEALELVRKPVWTETTDECRAALQECIGISATRAVNREMKVSLPLPSWAEERDGRKTGVVAG